MGLTLTRGRRYTLEETTKRSAVTRVWCPRQRDNTEGSIREDSGLYNGQNKSQRRVVAPPEPGVIRVSSVLTEGS